MTKILVIEDEKLVRANILELLEAEDFEAIGAENGNLGIQLALRHLPDLIICDVMMPDLNGYSVLNTLRQEVTTATIPFIFLTAKVTQDDFRQGMRLGADDYLAKPCTPNELLEAIITRLEKQAIITQQYTAALQEAKEKLNYLAHYDSLTNLPNLIMLEEWFQQRGSREQEFRSRLFRTQSAAILSIGLDQFNRINNTLGYLFGNLVLKAVAERLVNCVGENAFVARLNADLFSINLPEVNHSEDVSDIARAVLAVISQPLYISGHEVFITTSIGIILYPQDNRNLEDLMTKADAAMRKAKQQGGNQYQFYDSNITVNTSHQIALEASLHHALERSELQVYYQPQLDLGTRKITSAEALLRWHHPERGFVSPAEFIPIAEETGLIIPIGEWVLRTVCQQAQTWQAQGYGPIKLAVNLSGRQFGEQDITQKIAKLLRETGFEPRLLELELTETTILQDVKGAIKTINDLKTLGIYLAMDDFGTGYSSLYYLQNLAFDVLKIDQCFIRNITTNTTNKVITKAIIQMAHNLKLKVLAEGVETEAELDFLHQQQCDAIQGYIISRPLPRQEFEELLARERVSREEQALV